MFNKLRTGHGIYKYKKGGHVYEGKWKDNQKHGIGKMQFKKKGTYFGKPVFMRLLPKQQETRRRAVYLSEW